MKKKGFTLVELLAVIVIIALISLIAIPAITDIIRDSKKQTITETTKSLVRIAKNHYNTELIFDEFEGTIDIKELNWDGEKPKKGIIEYNEDGNVRLQMYYEGYCVERTYSGDIILNKTKLSECKINHVTIMFETNDENIHVENREYEKGETYGELPTLSKEGYAFLGWYFESTYENLVTNNLIVTESKILYAKWEEQIAENSISKLKVSFVRDEQWGNTNGNEYANWNEIKVMKNGVNIAQGCPIITSWEGRTYENTTITDGSVLQDQWSVITSGRKENPRSITVMLTEPVNIDSIIIHRAHTDVEYGFYNRILVSADEINWYVVYDSDIDGVYMERASGKEFTTYYID